MAEFKDVIKQKKRMCMTIGKCGKCPLCSKEKYNCRFMAMIYADYDEAEVETIERIVMDWAEKHPEPRCMSWSETWRRLFPGAKYTPCPESEFGVKMVCEGSCKECLNKPIPADIAEKLGIKPIGGEEDA